MTIYTLGYQGISLDEYIRTLRDAEVGIVLDVRDHAWSQRPEFVKSTLRGELASAGIQYAHLPDLGNPVEIRKRARSAKECLRNYRAYIETKGDEIKALYGMVAESTCSPCLTCYERDAQHCHRSVIVEALLAVDKRLEIIHLPPLNRRRLSPKFARNESLKKTAFLQPMLLPL